MDYVKDGNLILGSIEIVEQVEILLFLQKTLRTETSFSVRSKSSSGWKPYSNKENSKDRNIILGSIKIADQVETLCQSMRHLAVHILKKENMCCINTQYMGAQFIPPCKPFPAIHAKR